MVAKNTPERSDDLRATLTGRFPARLLHLRKTLGWSQSDLARYVFGTYTDAKGYESARGRDKISLYEAGRAEPSDRTLDRLVKALRTKVPGLTVTDLAPDLMVTKLSGLGGRGSPQVSLKAVPGRDLYRLVVDVVLPVPVANGLFPLINKAVREAGFPEVDDEADDEVDGEGA